MVELLQLPPEILILIAQNLAPHSRLAFVLTSRQISCTVRHLLTGHEALYREYRTINTRRNSTWNYLEEFEDDKYLYQYVETIDASERVVMCYQPYRTDDQSEASFGEHQEIQSGLEIYDRESFEFQGLMGTIDPDGRVQQWRENNPGELTAAESEDKEHFESIDQPSEFWEEDTESLLEGADSSEIGEGSDSSNSEQTPRDWPLPFGPPDAVQWYSDIECDRWFQNMPRPLWPYSHFQLKTIKSQALDTIDVLYAPGSNPLKAMIYSGLESPILARLLTQASNLKTLNICLRFNDHCLLTILKRIVDAYGHIRSGNFTAHIPLAVSSFPLYNLTRVSIVDWSPWCLGLLPLFTNLPSVEEIRLNNHGNYPSATQRARFPLDTGIVNGKHSNVKTLTIEPSAQALHLKYPMFLDTFRGLQSFFVEYDPRVDPIPICVEALNLSHFVTLKYLWFKSISPRRDPMEIIQSCREQKISQKRRNPFSVLHTLHAPWYSIVQMELHGYKLLGRSLRRLLLTGVPIKEQANIILCLDSMPELKEFRSVSYSYQLWWNQTYLRGAEYEVPGICVDEMLPELQREVIRRGIKWLTFGNRLDLESALTGRTHIRE